MKKILAFILIIFILLGASSIVAFADEPTATAAPADTPAPTAEPTSTPAPTDTPMPSATPSESPKPTSTAAPSPTASAKPSPGEKPVITKHPTKESIYAGGSCKFTAKATNYKWVMWYFAKGKTVINASDAAGHFSGLSVSGANSVLLTLDNVPSTLNGWRVAAVFGNDAGKTSTNNAYLEVAGSSGSSTSDAKSITEMVTVPSEYEEMIQAYTPMPIATPAASSPSTWVRTYDNPTPVPSEESETPVSAENKGGEPNTKSTSALSTLFIIIGIVAVVLLLCVTVIVLMLIKRGYDIEGIIMAIKKTGAKKQDPDYIGKH